MIITATKTYNQILTEKPTIENSLYTMGYPLATVSALKEWFGDRIVCDDNKFDIYYLRLARQLVQKYKAQLRIESADLDFDPMVENYSEHEVKTDGRDIRTLAGYHKDITPAEIKETHQLAGYEKDLTPAALEQRKKLAGYDKESKSEEFTQFDRPAEYQRSRTPAETVETFEHAEYTDKEKSKHIFKRDGDIQKEEWGSYKDITETDQDTKKLDKLNPMSISGVSVGSGEASGSEINGLRWDSSSSQAQQTGKGYTEFTHDMNGRPSSRNIEDIDEETEDESEVSRDWKGKDKKSLDYKNPEEEVFEVTQSGKKEYNIDTPASEKLRYTGDEVVSNRVVNNGKEKLSYTDDETKETAVKTAGSESLQYTGDEKTEYGKLIHEIYTGRTGTTPQKALAEAMNYLRTISPAFFDLTTKLEPVFLGVYDI